MHIKLSSSQIATLLGRNRYQAYSEAVFNLWVRFFKDDYQNLKTKLERKRGRQLNIAFTDGDKIKLACERNNVGEDVFQNIMNRVRNGTQSTSHKELNIHIKNLLKMVQELELDNEEASAITEPCQSIMRKSFGRVEHEDIAIDKVSEQECVTVSGSQRKCEKVIASCGDRHYVLVGKVDGIITEMDDEKLQHPIVLEIKNRTKELFNEIRDYEKLQMYCYMLLLNYNEVWLTEALKHDNQVDINVIKEPLNQRYMQQMQMELRVFCEFFETFLRHKRWREKAILIAANEDSIDWKMFDAYLNIEYSEIDTRRHHSKKQRVEQEEQNDQKA